MAQRNLWSWTLSLLLFGAGGCGGATEGPGGDGAGSETNWLSRCDEDSDCNQGSCLCGICTRPCEGDEMCSGVEEGASCQTRAALQGCDVPPPEDRGVCATEEALEVALEAAEGDAGPGPDEPGDDDDSADDDDEPADDDDEPADDDVPADDDEPADDDTPVGPIPGPGGASNRATKLDLLFVIDNSLSMGDKQQLLAQALPDLVYRLIEPWCRSESGELAQVSGETCPDGYSREFEPVSDIHIGVITSSLGGYGSELDCNGAEEGETDNSHLLGSLARVQATLPGTPEFLSWCAPGGEGESSGSCSATPETSGGDAAGFATVFADQVREAREQGCGWESTLESWYRFLAEPYPWTKVVRQNCPFGGDMNQLCVGPETDGMGVPYIDTTIIEQRKRFLRPDSVLALVMLTDENDCSFKASGQSWRLSQTFRTDGSGIRAPSRAYKGSAICATDPNDECCVSCGTGPIDGCPTATNPDGETVHAGCQEPLYKSADDLAQEGSEEPSDDAVNLRCFDHKRRFGVDYLYPVARYSNAVANSNICPFADDLDPSATADDGSVVCGTNQEFVVANPLYEDLSYEDRRALDPDAQRIPVRGSDRVFLAGIVGAPWQALAVDPSAATLEYRQSDQLDWVALLGSADHGAPYDKINAPPTNPHMLEQIDPRPGTDPAVNGGEWNILERDDLQYACTFPLDAPVDCAAPEDLEPEQTVACECTYYGDEAYANPLCDGLTQHSAKAYPSIRPLQVLRDVGSQGVVASVCAKNTSIVGDPDFGYRPAVNALIDRIRPHFVE